MHILSVHNRYQIRGGEEECQEAEVNLLRKNGHSVDVYVENNERLKELSNLHLAVKTIWSQEAYQTITKRLEKKAYDVVHVHNFLPLISPAIYYSAKTAGVPVVQTLHNYRLLCPNALFFREGRVCEDCLGKSFPLPGVVNGCYRNNSTATAVVTTMLTTHHVLQTWTKKVDAYIALTEFARQKFITGGLPADKITVKPNFVQPDPSIGDGKGGFALYVGRLSVEKGIDTLLQGWEQVRRQIPLKIVGDGPLAPLVQAATQKYPHIEWLGRQPMAQVHDLMGQAMFLVFPSKWYETFGRVAVEAFAKGTPVLGAKIGAIAELVEDGKTGWHFLPSNADDLAAKVEWLMANPHEITALRSLARAEFEAKYTAQQNYQKLINIYQQVQVQNELVRA